MSIKRFLQGFAWEEGCNMEEDENGDYVLYEDYEILEQKFNDAVAQNYCKICGRELDGYIPKEDKLK